MCHAPRKRRRLPAGSRLTAATNRSFPPSVLGQDSHRPMIHRLQRCLPARRTSRQVPSPGRAVECYSRRAARGQHIALLVHTPLRLAQRCPLADEDEIEVRASTVHTPPPEGVLASCSSSPPSLPSPGGVSHNSSPVERLARPNGGGRRISAGTPFPRAQSQLPPAN